MASVILAFNIRQSVYRQGGLDLFRRAVKSSNLELLPIVTLPEDGIEQRALKISKELPQLLERIGQKSVHLACYSSSGIDFRYAVSELGADKYVKTLTTICSPHQYNSFYVEDLNLHHCLIAKLSELMSLIQSADFQELDSKLSTNLCLKI